MKHFNPRELTKANGHPDTVLERLRREHAERLAESVPLMDHSIPLGVPPFADHYEIDRYYREKHRRGERGTYWPLHETKKY